MVVDCALRQEQPFGDLGVAKAFCDEREDLALASRQPSGIRAGGGPGAAADVADAQLP